jgi:hypothetical protein
MVLMTPHSNVLLHFPTGTQTLLYSEKLRHAYMGPPLLNIVYPNMELLDGRYRGIN